MKAILTAIIVCASLLSALAQEGQVTHIRSGATLPTTCKVATGDVFYKTTTPVGVKYCVADNTWGDKADLAHTHSESDITNLANDLAAKAAVVHAHAIADVTGLQTALNGKASATHVHDASIIVSGVFDAARIPALPYLPSSTVVPDMSAPGPIGNNVPDSGKFTGVTITGTPSAATDAATVAQLALKVSISGTPVTGNCAKWIDGSHIGDAGAACGSGTGGSESTPALSETTRQVISTKEISAPSVAIGSGAATRILDTALTIAQLPGNSGCAAYLAAHPSLPSDWCTPSSSPTDNLFVSDAASVCDATVGGGSTYHWVYYTGSAWASSSPLCGAVALPAGSGFATQYIDWNAPSGGASIANKPPLPQSKSDLQKFLATYDATTGEFTTVQPSCGGLSDSGNACMKSVGTGSTQVAAGDHTHAGMTTTVFSGTQALATGAIASGACASTINVSATGVASTDTILADFNADPTSLTGYSAATTGSLTIYKWPSANTVNIRVCNGTSASITPSAATLNVMVVR